MLPFQQYQFVIFRYHFEIVGGMGPTVGKVNHCSYSCTTVMIVSLFRSIHYYCSIVFIKYHSILISIDVFVCFKYHCSHLFTRILLFQLIYFNVLLQSHFHTFIVHLSLLFQLKFCFCIVPLSQLSHNYVSINIIHYPYHIIIHIQSILQIITACVNYDNEIIIINYSNDYPNISLIFVIKINDFFNQHYK